MSKLKMIQRLGAGIAALGVVLMFAVGCSSPPYGVEAGMTEEEVISVLGVPSGTTTYAVTGEKTLIYMDMEDTDILDIVLVDGKVTKIEPKERR